MGGARFQRHVKRRATRESGALQSAKSLDFGMGHPGFVMPSAAHDSSFAPASADKDGSDGGIWARQTNASLSFAQGGAHEFLIGVLGGGAHKKDLTVKTAKDIAAIDGAWLR
jgi:hypothetical protein